MRIRDIKNENVKKLIRTAVENKYTVTIPKISNNSDGTPFRIKKNRMLGWDILAAVFKKANLSLDDNEMIKPSIFNDFIILYDDK